MNINVRTLFKKRFHEELKILGCTEEERIEIEKSVSDEMIDVAISNFVNPKDYAWAMIQ